eukprot:1512307-Pyramimonas_sp.AAC.1
MPCTWKPYDPAGWNPLRSRRIVMPLRWVALLNLLTFSFAMPCLVWRCTLVDLPVLSRMKSTGLHH